MRDVPRRGGAGNLVVVETGGPFNFGDFPNDPDDAAHEDDVPAPAWLPPEDRLWRHPSEVARHGQPQGGSPPAGIGLPTLRRDRRFAVTVGVVGAAAVATAVVVAFTVTNTPGVKPATLAVASATNVSLATAPVATGITSPLALQMVEALRPSLVAIRRIGGRRADPDDRDRHGRRRSGRDLGRRRG